jgi:hypothetical protein
MKDKEMDHKKDLMVDNYQAKVNIKILSKRKPLKDTPPSLRMFKRKLTIKQKDKVPPVVKEMDLNTDLKEDL